MPNALFCFHSYGKWSKLRNGKKSRTCRKCRNRQVKNAGAIDQLFCWHHYTRGRKGKMVSEPKCVKCGKIEPPKRSKVTK